MKAASAAAGGAASTGAAAPARRPRRAAADREAEIAGRLLRHWHEAVPDDRMAHLVKDASRAFLRALQVRLAAHEVQLGHWVFLRILWQRAGAADAALLTQRELSIEAGVMEPTTFVALRGMAAIGYVTLEQSPENRKNVYVRLAPRGSALEQTLVPLAQEVNRIALQGVAAAEIASTRHCLLAAIDNLARDAQARPR